MGRKKEIITTIASYNIFYTPIICTTIHLACVFLCSVDFFSLLRVERDEEEGGGVQKNLKANRPNVHLLSLGPATSRLV